MSETPLHDPGATKTYINDWTADLAAASTELGTGTPLTITSATVTVDKGAVITAINVIPTGVLFKLAVAAVPTPPNKITTLTTVTLNNGDVDIRRHTIGVKLT